MGPRLASRQRWLRGLAAGALLLVPLACLSPTLPLPPPSRPDISPPDASGLTTIVGRVPGGTTALAQNLETGRLVGQVTGTSGDYDLRLEAAIGDPVVVWYRDGLDDSATVELTVPAETPDLGPLGGTTGTGD
jgi:hypothetical protein